MKYFLLIIPCALIINTSCNKAFSSQEPKVVSVTSSSTLSDKKDRYAASNISDRTGASWCEGKKDSGSGEWIKITYDKRVTVSELFVKNGYGEKEFWQKNNRVKDLKISSDEKQEVVVTLPDSFDKRSVKLPKPVEGKEFVFTIQSVYPGSKYKDTCMTELSVSDFTLKGESGPSFCGKAFKSFDIDLNYVRMSLNADGTADGSGSGGWQCGEFDSGRWESEDNSKSFSIYYYIKGEGGETCSAVNESGSLVLDSCPEKDEVVFEEIKYKRKTRCNFSYDNGMINIDNCHQSD